ncbi:MAG: hypothetical protein AVDCRST_MAG87-597 [uncultured Thermomicrobiales bacterium]|uniref:Uncharacterized protein n=1 Tax=uncultured Thermomicrobiales bacterium TaxID=1645740 RepID=A0A6J4UDV2_9BACT|nr:MAG: hypothetical protein AVDCRST_MAG87-597 [uncultured Thermomicrobiales bacterium]
MWRVLMPMPSRQLVSVLHPRLANTCPKRSIQTAAIWSLDGDESTAARLGIPCRPGSAWGNRR